MQQHPDAPQPQSELFSTPRGPATLVFGDELNRRRRLAGMVTELGGLVVEVGPVAAAAEALRRQTGTAVAVIDVESDGGASLDRLLRDLEDQAAEARLSALVIADQALIDVVAARISQPEVQVVVGLDDADILPALSRLLAPRGLVAEPSPEENARRLAELSDEAARISRALASLSTDTSLAEAVAAEPTRAMPEDRVVALATVRAMIRLRRMREQFFDRALFADPAWDMLLDLFAARLEGRQVAVSSLCIAAAVPPTTALRWIAAMTEQGLLLREPDPDDRRRIFIALSAAAEQGMTRFLNAVSRVLAPTQG